LRHQALTDLLRPPAAILTCRPVPPRAGHQPFAPAVDVEVAGDVAVGPDAASPCASTDQPLHRLLARRGWCVEGIARDDPLGDVVEALEAPAARNGEQTGTEQELQRHLPVAPAPPLARSLARLGE